jgi:hypothetical protein
MLDVMRRVAVLAAATATTAFAFTIPAGAVTGTAAPATPTTATAAAMRLAVQDCPSQYACLWTQPGWTGERWQGKNRNKTLPDFIGNKSRSSANHGVNSVACFWTDPNGQGQVLAESLGSIREDLALDARPGGGNWANIISSLTWGNC